MTVSGEEPVLVIDTNLNLAEQSGPNEVSSSVEVKNI